MTLNLTHATQTFFVAFFSHRLWTRKLTGFFVFTSIEPSLLLLWSSGNGILYRSPVLAAIFKEADLWMLYGRGPMTNLNLRYVEPALRDEAITCLIAGDAVGFISLAISNCHALSLVIDNLDILFEKGLYEMALLHAYLSTRVNNRNVSENSLRCLFSLTDRARLRGLADPLPGKPPYTIYRGVAGKGASRRNRGISWTASLKKAWWFALRFSEKLADPAVYQAVVDDRDILAYTNARKEQEFLVMLQKTHRLVRVAKPVALSSSKTSVILNEYLTAPTSFFLQQYPKAGA